MPQAMTKKTLRRDFLRASRLLGIKTPCAHQYKTFVHIAHNKPVILIAPTGSGKTEAAVLPLLARQTRTERLTYVLPLRALTDQISRRLRKHAVSVGWSEKDVQAFHGETATIHEFPPNLLVTTLDQAIAAYSATPLSSPLRWGHVLGGHLATSLVVFDEVHLYDPDLGLQAALVMAQGILQMGLPIIFATATLPDRVVKELQGSTGAEIIYGNEIVNRRVNVHILNAQMDPTYVLRAWEESRKLLVFRNTVPMAQELYEELKKTKAIPPDRIVLLHSRFTPEDRRAHEEQVERLMGRDSPRERALCIATSAAEAGMDISADRVLTDPCPATTFIQRAGRCARWGGKGRVDVLASGAEKTHGPYNLELCESTVRHLRHARLTRLDWRAARRLVNNVYSDLSIHRPESLARVCWLIDEGTYNASRHQVHQAVREDDRVEVSVHSGDLPTPISRLPRVPVRIGSLRSLQLKKGMRWNSNTYRVEEFDLGRARPGDWLILGTSSAGYSPEIGLKLGQPGSPMDVKEAVPGSEDPRPEGPHTYGDIPWVQHTRAVLCALLGRKRDLENILETLGCALSPEHLAAVLALHDLGKLNRSWQERIGLPTPPLSHYSFARRIGQRSAPPHATVSAVAIDPLLVRLSHIGIVTRYVVAHHHRARASECPPFEMIDGFESLIVEALSPLDTRVRKWTVGMLTNGTTRRGGPSILPKILPVTRRPTLWTAYLALSRLLVLADRESLGGTP
jgi:CRISPR-associated endonuclease/helicase Cas3